MSNETYRQAVIEAAKEAIEDGGKILAGPDKKARALSVAPDRSRPRVRNSLGDLLRKAIETGSFDKTHE